jgi:diguanylate cyclase (GGDEF)-like protein
MAQAGNDLPLSLVFIDLDHFKRINDELGHLAGDEVLRGVAQVIRDSVAPDWLAGRLGGEEFAVVMPGVGVERALVYAEALRRAIENHHIVLTGGARAVTTSVGVVQWHPGFATSAELMRAADAQLFRAKSEGRNRVCVG